VESGADFRLYASYSDILKNPYRHGTYYVAKFMQSLRGLVPGAPVEYRGIRIGHVERILIKEFSAASFGEGKGGAIPVLLYLEPGRFEVPDNEAMVAKLRQSIENGIPNGLRATLATGNLLTGKQLIQVDYFANAEPAELDEFDGYPVIPSIETGVGRLGEQVNAFLEKLNALPLDDTIAGVNGAIARLEATLASANRILESDGAQSLPDELAATVAELRRTLDGLSRDSELYQNLSSSVNTLNATLENLNNLARQLSDQPGSVLFPAKPEADPIPEAN